METIQAYLDSTSIINALTYITTSIVLFAIGKLIYSLVHRKIDLKHELVEKDNFAFILSYVGYFTGLIIIIGAAIKGDSYGLGSDVAQISLYSTLGILLLHISIWASNKLILPKFDIKKEIITDKNAGTGIIEASIYIANGLVLYAALVGESNSLAEGIKTFIAYWFIGNIVLIIAAKIFSLWMKYDIHHEIEKDNVAAGVSFSGAILAMSIIIMNALIDPFIDWTITITDVIIYTVLGCILLPIVRWLADKLLLPGRSLTDEISNQETPNIGAGLLEAFAYIGAALLIIWSL
jgi:uncharacterized membrane protein YjfL (UPF0719 family)